MLDSVHQGYRAEKSLGAVPRLLTQEKSAKGFSSRTTLVIKVLCKPNSPSVFCLQPLGIRYKMAFTWQLNKLQCFSPQTAAEVRKKTPTQKDTYSWANAKRINTCICAWEEQFYNPCYSQLMLPSCFRVLRVNPFILLQSQKLLPTWFLSWDSNSILRLFTFELRSKRSTALSRSSWFFKGIESCKIKNRKKIIRKDRKK